LLIYSEENEGDIHEVDLRGNTWSKHKSLGSRLNTKFTESSACYSPDGKYLYFVSDRPNGSRGGRDIYRLELEARTPAENLGPIINSPYDEEGVFMHPDGKTLYFSSKGHDSMGGYDIFKSTLNENGQWSEPENLGWPINTPDDDVYFVMGASGQRAYYASDQPGGMGGKDIYRVTFLGPEPAPVAVRTPPAPKRPVALTKAKLGKGKAKAASAKKLVAKALPAPKAVAPAPAIRPVEAPVVAAATARVTILKGMVLDAVSKQPLGATIEVIDNAKNEVVATHQANTATGHYLICLPSGMNYGLSVRRTGYLLHSENFNLPADAPYAEIRQEIALTRPVLGATVELRNIFFAPGQPDLRPESAPELVRLKQLLTEQPNLRLELMGPTNSPADATADSDLSQQRAEAVLAYLAAHGIARTRLSAASPVATGQPVASLADATQPGSRPTEFKVIASN
jgi:outer membrane protein OmpA-like peptidoglycan-associated protein